ncbi:MAG: nucleotidyltransferase domain-containing protein [Prolixibacteraceae bacterium]|nr:nucleotidyltransferase domain-containing protein [Prolixibacteraceae bacterium]
MGQQEILYRIKSGIKAIDSEAEIYLFGSRARGDNRHDSDWDILVVSSKNNIDFEYESELRDPIYDLELESGEVISLLIYSKTDWIKKRAISPLFTNVLKEGVKI